MGGVRQIITRLIGILVTRDLRRRRAHAAHRPGEHEPQVVSLLFLLVGSSRPGVRMNRGSWPQQAEL